MTTSITASSPGSSRAVPRRNGRPPTSRRSSTRGRTPHPTRSRSASLTAVDMPTMIEAIRQAENDKTVKAIVLRVDSPGGSALASDLIWHELRKCKKPVLASMSDVAASGGYYISAGAKRIFAEPGTLTGSIGVVGGKMATGGMWNK